MSADRPATPSPEEPTAGHTEAPASEALASEALASEAPASEAPASEAPASVPARWVEPASLLTLRWGAYRPRLVTGLVLIVVGMACILGTTAYSLPLLLLGSLMQPAGWAIMPSTIGRRVAVPVPVLGFTWLMLGGSGFAWCYAIALAAWLLVRLRPLPAFAALALPVVWSAVLPHFIHGYQQGWVTILTTSVVVVASAWLARWIALRWDSWQSDRTLRNEANRLD